MKILAIGAHADDVELGCGGALARWSREGHDLVIHVATDSAYAAPDGTPIRAVEDARAEAEAAAARLGARLDLGTFPVFGLPHATGLADAMVALFERERPDLALVHWDGDTHLDHRALSLAVQHASRRCPRLLGYASNWYLGAQPFDARMFVDISDTLDEKIALIATHVSENARTRGAWETHARQTAADWGRRCGVAAAEGFALYRYLL
jgi:LmbE family N-acetylglucosaminyl deacetylase